MEPLNTNLCLCSYHSITELVVFFFSSPHRTLLACATHISRKELTYTYTADERSKAELPHTVRASPDGYWSGVRARELRGAPAKEGGRPRDASMKGGRACHGAAAKGGAGPEEDEEDRPSHEEDQGAGREEDEEGVARHRHSSSPEMGKGGGTRRGQARRRCEREVRCEQTRQRWGKEVRHDGTKLIGGAEREVRREQTRHRWGREVRHDGTKLVGDAEGRRDASKLARDTDGEVMTP